MITGKYREFHDNPKREAFARLSKYTCFWN